MAQARLAGVQRLYLLTAVARPLFEQLGFHAIDRSEVPASVRATEEFSMFRHPSAVCMTRALG
jgi:N-acetylglutamate synthase-like GNAT family acetyltransferase